MMQCFCCPDGGHVALGRRTFLQGSAAVGALAAGLEAAAAPAFAAGRAATTASAVPPTAPVANRAPLAPAAFTALPLGSVRARGWLLTQLQLSADGLSGHADEVLTDIKWDDGSECIGPNNAWRGGNGDNWERGPYWIKGLVALAWTLDDPTLKSKAQVWIDAILSSQQPDGYIGPKSGNDWWPRNLVTYLLRDYYEATADTRVIPFLRNFFQYMANTLGSQQLIEWGKARAGDQIETVLWLYNRTGDSFLLTLADTLAAQSYNWRDIMLENTFMQFGNDFHPKHAVNVAQALKMPAVYWQRSKNDDDRRAYTVGLANLLRDHGLACGTASGTEFLAGVSAMEGVELCAIVERMLSDETALRVLGDPLLGDTLEQVAFNALPAATTRSIRQHVYFTLPNNVNASLGQLGYTQDYEDQRTPGPHSGFPCCSVNMHMGWPKLAQNAWAATADGGLAALVLVPSAVTAPVADGTPVTLTADTAYPFGESITYTVFTPKKTKFPLSIRIPTWCRKPSLTVNGRSAGVTAVPGSFARIDRTWSPGDTVVLTLPMTTDVQSGVADSVTVQRGPILYSLPVGENWTVRQKGTVPGFDFFSVTATTPWNYGLAVDPAHPSKTIAVVQGGSGSNPFELSQTPILLQVPGVQLPSWTMAYSGLVPFDPPASPVAAPAGAATTALTLAPFGAQMLRITNFPLVGAVPAPKRSFTDDFKDGDSLGWITYGGGWFVGRNALRATPNSGNPYWGEAGVKAIASGTSFADFTYDAHVSVGGQGNAGVLFRASDATIGPDAYRGYYAGISAADGSVALGWANNGWNQLASASIPVSPGLTYHLRVVAVGSSISVFVTDMSTPILTVTDSTYATGAIGVRHYNTDPTVTQAAFSKISVRAA
ncbi:MAG: glycoside hydrolase family 127 protein [Gluconacetobacter diazotrophicus]|nr:glycoside hydrolase family 127 protein [Gluconacetobacter diazotrophicus]